MTKKLSSYYEKYSKELGYKDWNTAAAIMTTIQRMQFKDFVRSVFNEENNRNLQLSAIAQNKRSLPNVRKQR